MNEVVKSIIERASCNKYKPEHLKKEDIDLIVKAGLAAPSGGNRQPWRMVVVTNDELVKKLSKMNIAVIGKEGIDPFYGAPDVVLVFVEPGGTDVEDGSLALGNMLNAAYAMGLGGRWINRCKEMFETEEGKELLRSWNLPENLRGIGCCILGYPDMELVPREKVTDRVTYVD